MINETKLKIMLSAPDMKHYALLPEKLEGMTCTDSETRTAFRHIFDDAEAKSGFHTSGERLMVQMFTSKCGGCEIFVTRLEKDPLTLNGVTGLTPGEEALIRRVMEETEEGDDPWAEGGYDMRDPQETFSSPQVKDQPHLRRAILTVDSMDILLTVCKRLQAQGYHEESRCYAEKNRISSKYHLYLEIPDGIFYQLPERYAFLKEYGVLDRSKQKELYLSEHGQVICEGAAVSTLCAL